VFDHWLLDGSSVGSINPITIEMNMTHTLEAVFTQHISSYTVSVSGSIFTTKDPSGSQLYSGSSATTAIQTAINAASSGDTIHLNPATYTLSSTINGKNGVNLLGETGVIISMNNLGVGARAIFYSGSTGSSTTTTLQSMKGTKSITVSSTSGITSGELLFISTTQEWKGNTRHDQQGEIRTVDHISGNTVYLTETLEDTYPSSATVRVINPAKDIEVSSISFTGVQGRNQTGIVFSYGQNLKIHDLFFSHFENYAIGLFNVLNSEVYNNTIYYTNRPGYGYGIGMWFACQNINVHNNYGNTCRHMIAIACAVIPGIPRHIYIYNNTSTKATSAGFDCHSYGEDIQFINNLSTEDAIGMSMGMFSGLVKYNNITNSLYGGIVVGNLVGDDDVVVSYNTITGSKHEGITSRSKNVQILYNTLDYCNSGSVRSYASITLMRGATTDNDEIIYNYSADYCNIYGNTITRSGGANPCPDYYIAPGIVGTTNNKP
jgi:hypothetical protein